jgi:hypothetical protein
VVSNLSPNALRLLGKTSKLTARISPTRIAYFCREQFEEQPALEVASELVELGYLDELEHDGLPHWRRTAKAYTTQMRSRLSRLAALKVFEARKQAAALERPKHLTPLLTHWLGYPTAPPPAAVGKVLVHRLEDDEE